MARRVVVSLLLWLCYSTASFSNTCQDLYNSEEFRHPRNSALRYNSAITVSAAAFIVQNIGTVVALATMNIPLLAVALPSTIFSTYKLIDFSFDIRRYNRSKQADEQVNFLVTQAYSALDREDTDGDIDRLIEFFTTTIMNREERERKKFSENRSGEPNPSPMTFEYMTRKLVEMDQARDTDLCLIVFAEGTPYSLYQNPDFIAGRIWQKFLKESREA